MRALILPAIVFLSLISAATSGEIGYDAVLVRGDLPYEWVIAQAYSERAKIPIIPIEPREIKKETMDMLSGFKALDAERILILGGESAVSPEIVQEIESIGFTTHRISEIDRYGTSARVAVELYPDAEEVIVVSAEKADFLLLGERLSLAAGMPILFVKQDSVPKSAYGAIDALKPGRILLITGSDAVEKELAALRINIEKIRSYEEIDKYDKEKKEKEKLRIFIFIVVLVFILILFFIYRRREAKKLAYTMLTQDEDKIISTIENRGGEVLQEELYEITGFSRPKISRLVSDLENRKLIVKEQFKKTFKLKINKEVI